jgi:PadR family transcriptional regulator, regulatory protein PadR
MDDKDLYAGLIRLHILHHAVEEGGVYGLWMIEELGRHGYRLSAGTLYPILHGLEGRGYLRSTVERAGARTRRIYRATPEGVEALATAKQRVWELFGELFESAGAPRHAHYRDVPASREKRDASREAKSVQAGTPRRSSGRRGTTRRPPHKRRS